MDLILWRHANAVDGVAGQSDLDRALSGKGLDQAARVGRWLHGVLPADARVLASPARRTQETARALGRAFDTAPALAPEVMPRSVLDAAGWPHAGGTVVVVGHQPTLGQVAAQLLAGLPQPWEVGKGDVWWLRRDGVRARIVTVRGPDNV
jgi:phosphohistidine phosphatase